MLRGHAGAIVESLEQRQLFAIGTPIGFGAAATGGGSGPTVTVTTAADFAAYATQAGPVNIQVQGSINIGSVKPTSNKTILGLGADPALVGSIGLYGVSNVIIQNLTISNPNGVGEGDGITIKNSTQYVWVDHCTFLDTTDGQLDITQGSDFVTASWNKFTYNTDAGHNFSMLIGAGDDAGPVDSGKLHVTLHHNWWSTLADQRMPSVRFGDVHAFNNYYNAPNNLYCINVRIESEVLIQNNSFENVRTPYQIYVTTGITGKAQASGNQFVNTTGTIDDGNDVVFTPPYAYTLDPVAGVKANVTAGAGVGKLGLDTTAPTSAVKTLPANSAVNPVTVSWSGSDAASGVKNFDVYVSDNGGTYTLWKSATTVTSAAFTGVNGHTYRFYSRARDNAGNLEAAPAAPDATTRLRLPSNWWKFNETSGTSAFDSSGGITGTLTNFESTDWTAAGKSGGALSFDGVNERVSLGNNLNVTKNFTIAGWIKPTSTSGFRGLFGKLTDSSNKQYQLSINNGKLDFQYERGGNNWSLAGGTILAGVWQHVAVTVDSALKVTLFVNGLAVGSATAPTETLASNSSMFIGRWGGNYNANYYAGAMDDLKFFTTAVSAAEILQLAA